MSVKYIVNVIISRHPRASIIQNFNIMKRFSNLLMDLISKISLFRLSNFYSSRRNNKI